MPKVLAIIPARGGSKGLPRKNVRALGGKPLIAHSIDTARRSSVVDRVIVTTEDEEIAQAARAHGGDVPFMRPLELSADETLMFPVLIHAVQWLQEHENYRADYVLLLQPTCPFRTPEDIEAVLRLAIDKDADAVVSVGPVHQHPHWMKRIDDAGRLVDYWTEKMPFRRQELKELHAINGAIYLVKTEVLLPPKPTGFQSPAGW